MAKVNLTAGRIRDLQLPEGKQQAFLWDSAVPGLGVRVTAGSKSFIFQSKYQGKDIRMTVGDVSVWAIESNDAKTPSARREARRLQSLIDQGIDPRQAKAAEHAKADEQRRVEENAETTVRSAWEAYIKARAGKWSDAHVLAHQLAAGGEKVKGPIYELLDKRLADIQPELVRDWLTRNKKARPTYAASAFRKLRAFLNWCADQPRYTDLINANACGRRISRDEVPKSKAKSDCLQREQLAPWFEAVRKLSNPVVANYLQILLLVGARREELATLRWENVDLRWKSMVMRDKIEGERTIPLTPYVEKLLRELKAINETPPPEFRILHGKKIKNDLENWKPSPWVFFSKTAEDGRMVEPRIGHNRALTAAGLPALTLHGLRRSFGTLAEWVECPVGISAQIMGHKPSALAEKHYRQRPLDLLRMWHSKIEGWILEQAGIAQPKVETAPRPVEVAA